MSRGTLAFAIGLSLLGVRETRAELTPAHLRCEYRVDPLGIDAAQPRLSWVVQSRRRAERQTAYQVLGASSLGSLQAGRADLWNSGKVSSDETAQVAYGGRTLASGQECWWKVRCWDRDGHPSPYSAPARWSMGLLRPTDWKAQWISFAAVPPIQNPKSAIQNRLALPPCPFLRRTFTVSKPVRRAFLTATALGLYEMHLDGRRVGDELFRPGWTDYRKRVYYQTYDVTHRLPPGRHALGALLGDGWACGYVGLGGRDRYRIGRPRLLAQLNITYADGTRQIVSTDSSWKGAYGPLLESDLLMGETYDARRERRGWDTASFSEAGWQPVTVDTPWPAHLEAYPGVPVRRMLELRPASAREVSPGTFIFDMGQNMVGWARLAVKGPAGTTVRLRFAEVLNPNGTLYTANLRGARCTDTYSLRGGARETWEPRFTFHGFRYVEVTGYPGRPPRDAVTGVVVHSDTPKAGSFICSNRMVNQLQHNIEWGQRGNFLEVPTDCPQRDERLGWMGDAQIFVRTACDNMDVAAFFTKWMRDVEDAQRPDGAFTDVSPLVAGGSGTAAWGDAGVIVPWTIYQVYGDRRIIAEHYGAMTRWIDYLQQHSAGLLRPAAGYGDWVSAGAETPTDVLATAYFAYSTSLVAKMARALGREADARRYDELFIRIRGAFNRAYVAPDGRIKGNTQTCYALALQMNLLSPQKQAAAARYLVDDIRSRGGHLSTGFVGTGYLAPVLSRAGRTPVAYRLLTNDTYPSWGYEIKHGATTIWERWDGVRPSSDHIPWSPGTRYQDPGMNSFNHYAFGAVGQWLFSAVAGIDTDPAHPGFRHILIHPQPGGGLTWARATYESIRGPIASRWKREGGRLILDATIPANTTATIAVPAPSARAVSESGRPAAGAPGLRYRGMDHGAAVFEASSGDYHFVVSSGAAGARGSRAQRAADKESRPPMLKHAYADVNGVRLHYVTTGTGKLIMFVHGFPEFWYEWKNQLAEFGRDYQAVAPDMRGYNRSSKPAAIDQYQLKYLVEDLRELVEHLGQKKLILVGHDWGGVVAWVFAMAHPEQVEKLVIINAPHPGIFQRELKENPAQQKASQYMLMFRSTDAEQILSANQYAPLVEGVLGEGLKQGSFTEEDRKAYLEAWSQPGALTGGLNYYRAARVGPPTGEGDKPANLTADFPSLMVNVPTLVIWGEKDEALLTGNLEGLDQFVPHLTVKRVPDGSHWVVHQKPALVNAAIREFIEKKAAAPKP